jgi:hypothetical protein
VVSIGQHTAQRAQQQAGGLEEFPGKSDIGNRAWPGSLVDAGSRPDGLLPAMPKLRAARFWLDPK